MRKYLTFGLAAALALALAAVALGQVAPQSNTYTVDGSVTPTKSGTSSRPAPVRVRFDFQVGETNNLRPSVVRKYSIAFDGLRVNTNAFPKCSNSVINTAKSIESCPSGSTVGTGFIVNATGSSTNTADKSVPCNASVTVVNGGDNKATLFIKGDPASTNPATRCAIELATGIQARYIRGARGVALEFEVPPNLRHPVPGLDNAVQRVTSTIRRLTRVRNGKRLGYFETIGGCRNRRRAITVTFTPEVGSTARGQKFVTCS